MLDALKERVSSFKKWLFAYANVSSDLEPQADIEASIRSGVSFKGSQLLILIFAILVASLGLNADSIPVVIGAMLISPLMGPIIGMGLAIGIQDFGLLKRGFINICMAVIGSLVASTIFFIISPQFEGSSQLLARTTPTLYDALIAFFGGGAGIVSIACRNKGQVLPGVAIATSLMPPLCTAGYGIATLQPVFIFGALYLFFTNMIFILFATWIGVKLMKFKPVAAENTPRHRRVQNLVYLIVTCTIIVSAYLTYQMINRSIFMSKASAFIENQMDFKNTQVLSHKIYMKDGKRYINVNLIGEELPADSLQVAMVAKLDSVGLGGTILNIKQGVSIVPGSNERNYGDFASVYNVMQKQLNLYQNEVDSLKNIINSDKNINCISREIMPEVKILFPAVSHLALMQTTNVSEASSTNDTINIAIVATTTNMTKAEQHKLTEYLNIRTGGYETYLIENPIGYPWNE